MIDGGRLVEIASHDELVAQGERYAALWASWEAGRAPREGKRPWSVGRLPRLPRS